MGQILCVSVNVHEQSTCIFIKVQSELHVYLNILVYWSSCMFSYNVDPFVWVWCWHVCIKRHWDTMPLLNTFTVSFLIIRTPIICILMLGRCHAFGSSRKKTFQSLEFCYTGERKAAVWTTFPDATTPFSSSTGFWSQFTTSELDERSCVHCSTLYYSMAN